MSSVRQAASLSLLAPVVDCGNLDKLAACRTFSKEEKMDGFWRLSAIQLLAGYAQRKFSPVEVLDELLDRVERLNPLLRAYLAINDEDARRAAMNAERVWRSPGKKPLLCGVPVSVKDTIEMRGLPTTYGSLAFKTNYQEDSEIVMRLRRAGAVIIGKTNTPEFALLAEVRNRLGEPGANPWGLDRTCGGSSGGAAAAVAAGLGQLAVGTDSGGSIRAPAAYTGVFGLKPSRRRLVDAREQHYRSLRPSIPRRILRGRSRWLPLEWPTAGDPDRRTARGRSWRAAHVGGNRSATALG